MKASVLTHLKPLSAVPAVDSDIRLSLNPVLSRRSVVDGAWWPHSRDAAAELPGLIAAVDQRLDQTTLRVGVREDAWDHIPRRIPAPGRQVKVGWFRNTDPHVITLILAGAEPVVLLVIPPDTASGPAEAALKLGAEDTTGLWPVDLLTSTRLPATGSARQAGQEVSDGWENEGGHITGPPIG
ncbi:DUF5994 family protein [Nonomuraea sp. NEAU-A123]|uniref:DUF5994 family protein n=1 Tax=Nonomuraea sp. NEAU-A123 TaxID=2839649 RepID=UPI001BE4BDF1|nr:DUF5994 family protein [Nonomuraea sp. NEAU-A123]MBT2229151.1 hypothetical protein [Nonomuraea sp. NEAU-A123]